MARPSLAQNAQLTTRPTVEGDFVGKKSISARALRQKRPKKQRVANDNEMRAEDNTVFDRSAQVETIKSEATGAVKAFALKAAGPYILSGAGLLYLIVFVFHIGGLLYLQFLSENSSLLTLYPDTFSTQIGTVLFSVAIGFAVCSFVILYLIFYLANIPVTKGWSLGYAALIFGLSAAPTVFQLLPWQILWAGSIIYLNKRGLKKIKSLKKLRK
ncbi:hypothetical protein KTR10_00860 [Candidatus Kaiserbacteria bacterium]|nr:hypothetical protein [Candidatus Kaiserbacteria bacterium]